MGFKGLFCLGTTELFSAFLLAESSSITCCLNVGTSAFFILQKKKASNKEDTQPVHVCLRVVFECMGVCAAFAVNAHLH